MTVFVAVVIRTFEQKTVWKTISNVEVNTHWRNCVGQQFFILGAYFKFLHESFINVVKIIFSGKQKSPAEKRGQYIT
jgi:hypothetical protein